jgi:hypothetical protein
MDFLFPDGAPIWIQHLSWLLSKPAFWLVLTKWLLIFAGVIVVAIKLFKAKYFFWLCIFIIAIIACTYGIYDLTQKASQLLMEGRSNEVILLRVFGVITDILALLVLIKLFRHVFFKKLPKNT